MAFVNLPPNLQDMFYSITDRIAKLETGPNQAMYTAESAQGSSAQASAEAAAAAAAASAAGASAAAAAAAAGVAQAQATTALAEATLAYNKAVASLQPSASTIVNASNQMTAIATNGITVYSGSSSSSGARVVMNSVGLAGYNSSGTATFSVLASTGDATFSGNVTGSTITGGTLNIAGNAIINSSGILQATGATITGTINANAGYFGTSTNGFSINSTGMVGVGNGIISGGTITTSTGSNAVVLDGANNALGIKYGGTYAGWLLGIGSGSFMMHYGTTPDIVSGYPRTSVSSTSAILAANASNSISVTTTGTNYQGNSTFGGTTNTFTNTIVANGTINYVGIATGSGTGVVCATSGQRLGLAPSSERFKVQVKYLESDGWLNKVLNLKPISYIIDKDFLPEDEDNPTQVGFLAEDVNDIGGGLENAVNLDPMGEPFSLAYDRFAVFLTLAMKEIDARLTTLEGK